MPRAWHHPHTHTHSHSQYHSHIHSAVLTSCIGEKLVYGTVPYQEMIHRRSVVVYDLLRLDYKVLLSDVDAVWLQNPLPWLHQNEEDLDIQAERADVSPLYTDEDFDLNGGFVYLKPNMRVLKMWRTMLVCECCGDSTDGVVVLTV